MSARLLDLWTIHVNIAMLFKHLFPFLLATCCIAYPSIERYETIHDAGELDPPLGLPHLES